MGWGLKGTRAPLPGDPQQEEGRKVLGGENRTPLCLSNPSIIPEKVHFANPPCPLSPSLSGRTFLREKKTGTERGGGGRRKIFSNFREDPPDTRKGGGAGEEGKKKGYFIFRGNFSHKGKGREGSTNAKVRHSSPF